MATLIIPKLIDGECIPDRNNNTKDYYGGINRGNLRLNKAK
jgi:hypothetical protein